MTAANEDFLAFACAFAESELKLLDVASTKRDYAIQTIAELHAAHGATNEAIRWARRLTHVGTQLRVLGSCTRVSVECGRAASTSKLWVEVESAFKQRRKAGLEGRYGVVQALSWMRSTERATRLGVGLDGSAWSYNGKREVMLARLFFDRDFGTMWKGTAEAKPAVRDGLRSDAIYACVAWGLADHVRDWAAALDAASREAVLRWLASASGWHVTPAHDDIIRTLRSRAGALDRTRDGFHEAFTLLGRARHARIAPPSGHRETATSQPSSADGLVRELDKP